MYYYCTSHTGMGGRILIRGTMTEHLIPDTDESFNIGSPSKKVDEIYLSENSLYLGTHAVSASGSNLHIDGDPLASVNYVDTEIGNITAGDVKTFVITYAANDFVIDGDASVNLRLQPNTTYKFDLSDSSLTGHDFAIKDSSGAYTSLHALRST